MEAVHKRSWTLEGARAVFGDVRRRTEQAVHEAEEWLARRDAAAKGSPERERAEHRVQEVMGRWAREMEALGLEVKGLWLVDFDSGSGYYCWRWPEEELAFFHGYDEGFAGRVRIQ
jgi:hypothetical protein